MTTDQLAAFIDHTLLRPETTVAQVVQLCEEALKYKFAAVCVPPVYVCLAATSLGTGAQVKIATVVGFPLGYQHKRIKLLETEQALTDGATEIDAVMNMAAFKSGELEQVQDELSHLARLCHSHNAQLKVIIETALLTEAEIVQACTICTAAEVDYVKTSTGFSARGASVQDVVLMRRVLPNRIKIKAAGGIKTFADAQALIKAGADRLGCSAGIQIISYE